jgi:hypothetical protein
MKYFNTKIALISIAFISFTACNNTQENTETTSTEEVKICALTYDAENTTISFGAFKTTAKVEVKGKFEAFDITNTKTANTVNEVFADAEFIVYVKSLETENEDRNLKIRENFFATMIGTTEMKGHVTKIEGDKIFIDFTMNEVTKNISLDYKVEDKSVSLEGTINVLDWNAAEPLAAINKACFDLHKGEDGVSKTWADVNLYINSTLKSDCE